MTSTDPVIPDEAVEAAAEALDPQTMGSGGALAEKFKEETRAEARRILEAAAPHLMASVSTLEELTLLEPGTVIQGPDFHGETYKCTAPATFHAIASPTEYRPSELVGRGPFTIIHHG